MPQLDEKPSLPNLYDTLVEANTLVRQAESLAKRNPNDFLIKTMLKTANNLLFRLREADDKAFIEYAQQLAARINEPDYPHSIKAWYEDDFKYLLEDITKNA